MSTTRTKSVRNGHRTHIKKLIGEANGIIEGHEIDINKLTSIHRSLLEKLDVVKDLDEQIMQTIEEGELIEAEITETSDFIDRIHETVVKIEATTAHKEQDRNESSSILTTGGSRKVRLPKLEIRSFEGYPLELRGFWDLFKSSIGDCDDISDIDKFSYLRGLLKGPALDLISGLTLSASNYDKALDLLSDRFGNRQTLITKYLDVLATLPKVQDINDVISLRKFFDTLETSVRNLTDLGKETESYGSLLISIIFDRIPEELQMIISRHFKGTDWDLHSVISLFLGTNYERENDAPLSHIN